MSNYLLKVVSRVTLSTGNSAPQTTEGLRKQWMQPSFKEIGQEKEVKVAADRSWGKRNELELLRAGPQWRGLFARIVEFDVLGSLTKSIYETVNTYAVVEKSSRLPCLLEVMSSNPIRLRMNYADELPTKASEPSGGGVKECCTRFALKFDCKNRGEREGKNPVTMDRPESW